VEQCVAVVGNYFYLLVNKVFLALVLLFNSHTSCVLNVWTADVHYSVLAWIGTWGISNYCKHESDASNAAAVLWFRWPIVHAFRALVIPAWQALWYYFETGYDHFFHIIFSFSAPSSLCSSDIVGE
jgi:hypothetical protein